MSNLQDCPHCNKEIESDSIYCDQCGTELLKCSNCGKFLKGKFCPSCGGPAIPTSSVQSTPQPPQLPQQPQQQMSPQQLQQPQMQPQMQQQMQPQMQQQMQQSAPTPHLSTSIRMPEGSSMPIVQRQPTRMSYPQMGIVLTLQPGAIIGRTTGNYVSQTATFNYMSGQHALLNFNGMEWTITDLNSTNGTTVNGIRCIPGQPQRINIGDLICIGKTYNFRVE